MKLFVLHRCMVSAKSRFSASCRSCFFMYFFMERDMDKKMAGQIVDKKLGELRKMLRKKKVELEAEPEARSLVDCPAPMHGICKIPIQRQLQVMFFHVFFHGAGHMYLPGKYHKSIGGEVKPLLVDELLFGALKEGGKCVLTAREDKFGKYHKSLPGTPPQHVLPRAWSLLFFRQKSPGKYGDGQEDGRTDRGQEAG